MSSSQAAHTDPTGHRSHRALAVPRVLQNPAGMCGTHRAPARSSPALPRATRTGIHSWHQGTLPALRSQLASGDPASPERHQGLQDPRALLHQTCRRRQDQHHSCSTFSFSLGASQGRISEAELSLSPFQEYFSPAWFVPSPAWARLRLECFLQPWNACRNKTHLKQGEGWVNPICCNS